MDLQTNRIKLERMKDYPKLKQEIISYLFDWLSKNGKRDEWYKYVGKFEYEGEPYELECECRRDNEVFSYRKLHICRPTQIIDVHDMERRGMLN